MTHIIRYMIAAALMITLCVPSGFAKRLVTPEGDHIDLSFIVSTQSLIAEVRNFSLTPPDGVTITTPIIQDLPSMIPAINDYRPSVSSAPSVAIPPASTASPSTATITRNVPTEPAPIARDAEIFATGDYTISIPAIGLSNVTITQANINDEADWSEALKYGVAQSLFNPGQNHKILIFGHSSRYAWDTESQISFKDLHKLKTGDRIYVSYRNKQYVYEVYNQEIVSPFTPSVMTDYGWEELVLFTCWPENSNKNRIILYSKPVTE